MSAPLLTVTDLVVDRGRVTVLHGVTLSLEAGEVAAVVGANGAGKTTFLRTLSGVLNGRAGRILYGGEDITRWSPHRRVAAGIGHVPEGRLMFADLTVLDNLRLGGYVHRRDHARLDRTLARVYELFPVLRERRDHAAGSLSGGQQQMVAIGRALMGGPRLLLMDEPSMGLAPLLVEEIFRVIQRLNHEEGVACLLVEQNARAALGVARNGHVLESGRVVLSGAAESLLNDPSVRSAYLGH
ncbi:MAG: ABC transporter ATP-binding protein [Magnetococcus sp. WYHC-3]